MKILKLFRSKKIIYTGLWKPGELVKTHRFRGKKYARIAFTSMIKYQGFLPITDVPFEEITAIRKLPSPAKKWLYSLFGVKARGTYYKINRSKIAQ